VIDVSLIHSFLPYHQCGATNAGTCTYLMRTRSQRPTTLSSLLVDCGIPRVIKSDNAPEFKGKRWLSIIQKYCITPEYTEAYHPNQNLAECRGGAIKAAVVHLMTVTKTPNEFWCYALQYICYIWNFIARRTLEWKTPYEKHWGDTPDISMFRFLLGANLVPYPKKVVPFQ
jgi:hypothetical protein